jgi:putative transposase
MIRQKQYPSVAKKLWGNALGSPSYFAASCGGAQVAIIRQDIEQQQTANHQNTFGVRAIHPPP